MITPPLPLPEGFHLEQEVRDTIDIDGLVLHRAGIAVRTPTGEIITGSAADLDGSAGPRARFELLERVATCEAIARGAEHVVRDAWGAGIGRLHASTLFPAPLAGAAHRPARSNGVALHASWNAAASAAHRELVERDHVLRAWYGYERPERTSVGGGFAPASLAAYEWRAYSFARTRPDAWSGGIRVHGVFGVPRRDDAPFVIGWGADADEAASLGRARNEATQMLAFLWGEEIPKEPPMPGPSAAAHLENVLYPGHRPALLAWLAGEHTRYAPPPDGPSTGRLSNQAVTFADLTPEWLGGGLRIAQARHPDALALTFGDAPEAGHLPPALRFHPIA